MRQHKGQGKHANKVLPPLPHICASS